MGKGMANNLASKGHSLVVYDVNTEAVADLGKKDNKIFHKHLQSSFVAVSRGASALQAVLRRLDNRHRFH